MRQRLPNVLMPLMIATILGALASPCVADRRGPIVPFRLPSAAEAERCLAARDKAMEAIASGDWAVAARHFRTAIEAFPESQSDWYDLGCMLSKQGDTEGALRALAKARDLGRLYIANVAADPDLAPLRDLPEHAAFLRSLESTSVRADEQPLAADLARTPEELDRLAEAAEAKLAPLERMLGNQYRLGMAQVARWKAASLVTLAGRAADPKERERLHWEALRSLLDETLRPSSESLANDVLESTTSPERFGAGHLVEVLEAAAAARLFVATLDSSDPRAGDAAIDRMRSDLLEIAASSSDQPALESVLVTLADLTADDLPRSSRFYRRLMAMATDKADARRRAERFAAGTVLAVEGLPEFSVTTTSGSPLANSTLLGHLTLVDVWGTWCGPCVADLPAVRALHEEYGARGVRMLGIAAERGPTMDPAVFGAWCAEHQVAWPQVLDVAPEPDALSDRLGIRGVPYYLLMDANGRVIAAAKRAAMIRPALDRALAGASGPSPDGR